MIAPRWIEEQQGVYIPLIDKVLLKDNVPSMPYGDFMEYAKANNVQIATKEELLRMYLQKEDINRILKEHNGDDLPDSWSGSSSEYSSSHMWFVSLGSGSCYYTSKYHSYPGRAVVALKEQTKTKENMKQFSLEEYLKNPNRKIVTRNGKEVRIICTNMKGDQPIVALVTDIDGEIVYTYTKYGINSWTREHLDLFFAPEKHTGWIVINKDSEGNAYVMTTIYDSKEKAEMDTEAEDSIGVCKIEWKE